jgi:hypothetical protein
VHKKKARKVCARRVRKAAVRRLVNAGPLARRRGYRMVLRGHRPKMFHLQRTRLPSTAMASAKKLGVRGHGGVKGGSYACVICICSGCNSYMYLRLRKYMKRAFRVPRFRLQKDLIVQVYCTCSICTTAGTATDFYKTWS